MKTHMAKLVSPAGQVSPLCAKTPRPINLIYSTWTLDRDAVSCPDCRAVLQKTEKKNEITIGVFNEHTLYIQS